MERQIITSMLDTDCYKLTMQQAVQRYYPEIWAQYDLILRSDRDFPPGFADRLREQVQAMEELCLSEKEKEFLADRCPYLSDEYLWYLQHYRFDAIEVVIKKVDKKLSVRVVGPWAIAILWEVPLMAIISELYFEGMRYDHNDLWDRTAAKASALYNFDCSFVDFGTRRRFSKAVHREVLRACVDHGRDRFGGSSNLQFCMELGLNPIGTVAHEWIMGIAALHGPKGSNEKAMRQWQAVYPSALQVALADTYTTEVFLRSFTKEWAARLDGVRQDSGDPLVFLDRMVRKYKEEGIDPRTKKIIFSDALDVAKIERIHALANAQVKPIYGIGTNLTNDMGVQPLNMVVKLTQVDPNKRWRPTVKLSDDPGKALGPSEEVARYRRELEI